MGDRTSYAPGTFCWVDLTTSDPVAAKEFYGGLFGWTATDITVHEDYIYSMQAIDGKWVAAIAPQSPEQGDAPPAWNHYVSVPDADEVTGRVAGLGGTVALGPFDVPDAGRQAVLQDPQGAWFMLWEPRQHLGAQLVNAPGALTWNELHTTDVAGALAFYQPLLGWGTEEAPGATMIMVGDTQNGAMQPGPAGGPPFWLAYFGSADLAASVARVGELGGGVLVEPTTIPAGDFAVVRDPQGAAFALFAGGFDD